jgi:catechol 2,3-dioxygenase-like lactoylglutathione lyase family enzyme
LTEQASIPVGMAGLRYPITQVSLVIDDIDALLAAYHRAFGWAPWQDFDHVPPTHHNEQYRGRSVDYSLRGAEVYVGSLNFELLKPLPGGDSLFHDHLRERGEAIASIASMFHERADGDAMKAAFRDQFGLEVINKADIGDHIEYFYVDTQADFGCPIESGSGHAIDFVGPALIFPDPDATFGPSPVSGITYGLTTVTLVVDDLHTKVANYRRAFGWSPWRRLDAADGSTVAATTLGGEPAAFDVRIARTSVGDTTFEIVEPGGGPSPWATFHAAHGDGLMGVTVAPKAPATIDDVVDQFAGDGIGVLASARLDGSDWLLLDSEASFKTAIAVAAA